MIITGGFNVYSIEVEQALLQHPDVMDSAVFGLPDAKWGERVAAVVQVHAGRSLSAEELIAFRQGADRQRQGAEASGHLARPAALEGRKSPEEGNSRHNSFARERR